MDRQALPRYDPKAVPLETYLAEFSCYHNVTALGSCIAQFTVVLVDHVIFSNFRPHLKLLGCFPLVGKGNIEEFRFQLHPPSLHDEVERIRDRDLIYNH